MRRTRLVLACIAAMSLCGIAACTNEAAQFAPEALAFNSNGTSHGNHEIFVGTTSGVPAKQVTDDPAYDSMWPRFSPDGRSLLFLRTRAGDHDTDLTHASLWTVGMGGTSPRRVLDAADYGWTYLWHPEWSPDGRHLVMLAGATAATSRLTITDADGRNPRDLLPPDDPFGGGAVWDPAWSFDGGWIVFAGCRGVVLENRSCPLSVGSQVYRVRPDGTDLRLLSKVPYAVFDPYPSPDGSRVVFIEAEAGTFSPLAYSLGVVPADGSLAHRYLINDGGANSRVAWASDDILYFHRRAATALGFSFGIWRIDADGSNLRQVYPSAAAPGMGATYEYPAVAWPVPSPGT